jgi:nucleoside-diphosphate-sugar epimerase
MPSLCRRIVEAAPGAVLELQGANSVRDMANGAWIARVCAILAQQQRAGTVNCGTGKGLTVLEMAQMLSRLFGRDDIRWQPRDGEQGDSIVADVSRLREWAGRPVMDDAVSCFVDFAAAFGEEEGMAV